MHLTRHFVAIIKNAIIDNDYHSIIVKINNDYIKDVIDVYRLDNTNAVLIAADKKI